MAGIATAEALSANFNIPDLVINSMAPDELDAVDPAKSPSAERNLTRVDRNPAAIATLGLLSLIYFAKNSSLTESEIIALRTGGAPPQRTREELEQLVEVGLIIKNESQESKAGGAVYLVNGPGSIEIALNQVQNPETVTTVIDQVYRDIVANPPDLPKEVYGLEEFRWTWDSVRDLVMKMMKENAFRKLDIALLGAPTIALFLTRCPQIVSSVAVFDKNIDMVKYVNGLGVDNIKATEYDALDPTGITQRHRFDAVVTDPPWHTEHYTLFADRAWEWLRPLGRVYMAMFSHETRPEAAGELAFLLRQFIGNGFSMRGMEDEFFAYTVPTFEARAFEKAGIQVKSRGSYGTLWVMSRNTGMRTSLCTTMELAEKLREEINFKLGDANAGLTVWLNSDQLAAPLLSNSQMQITPIGTMSNTSRSLRKAQGINAITSDHDALKINNPGLFAFIAGQLLSGNGQDAVEVNLRTLTSESEDFVDQLSGQWVTSVLECLKQEGIISANE